MLTSTNRSYPGRFISLAVASVVVLAGLFVPAPMAGAEECAVPPGKIVPNPDPAPGESKYKVVCPPDSDDGDDGDGGGGGGGGNEATCDLSQVEGMPNPHCNGEYACWANIPSALGEEEWPPDPPSPDAVYIFEWCEGRDPVYEWTWYVPEEPPLEDQALEAFGRLVTPEFTLAFNPPQQTFVNLDTWWWADGATSGEITGSSAFGVVAIGTPERIEVDPGDGGATLTCAWVTAKSDTCRHAYTRASVDGTAHVDGSPAYAARARLVYSVRFENDGAPLVLPGLPDQLMSPWETTAVPVQELQSIVTR